MSAKPKPKRAYAFYCPQCKKFNTVMREQRHEVLEYDVVVMPPTEECLIYDIEYRQRECYDSEALGAECINCGTTWTNYAAEDFVVIYDPETGEILDYGVYFHDFPEDLPRRIPIEQLKRP